MRLLQLACSIALVIMPLHSNDINKIDIPPSSESLQEALQQTLETPRYLYNIPLDGVVTRYIYSKCILNGINPQIFFALIKTESNYIHSTTYYNTNGTYDSGLCQINSSNKKWLSDLDFDIDDVYSNIDAGIYILKLNLDKTNGDYPTALTGYNTGKISYVNKYAKKVMEVANEEFHT